MAAIGSLIYGSDYNAVQNMVRGVLGDGGGGYNGPSNGFGYGQTLSSSAVAAGEQIIGTQWTKLADDLNKAYKHQNGSDFSGYSTYSAATGASITYDNLSALQTVANSIVTNKASIAASQKTILAGWGSNYISGSWGGGNSYRESTYTITWSSANDVHYFFNSGGAFTWTGSMIDPLLSSNYPTDVANPIKQDNAWKSMLGNFSFTFNRTNLSSFTPSASYTNLYTLNNGGSGVYAAYSSNNIKVDLLYNSGTTMAFRVRFTDGYSAGAGLDTVSGGAGYTITRTISSDAVVGAACTGSLTGF